jgi:hypothetical protein
MSLAKNVPLVERSNLQLRVGAFSVFNHPTFGITSAGGNRTVQLGAKLTF